PEDYRDALMAGKLTEKSISIGHVYAYIEGLGRYKPGNLKELHFFSRGSSDYGSPVLVRSYFATYFSTSGKVKFSSKYVYKDGAPHDLPLPGTFRSSAIKSLADFSAAFAKDSLTVLWGSFLNRDAFDLIHGVIHSKEYKKMLKDPADKLFDYLGTPMSLDDITEEIHKTYMENSYAHKLGVVTHRTGGKNVHLAPPGTDANTDDEVTQKTYGDPLMHIFMGEDFGDPPGLDFREILKFYGEVIGTYFLSTPGEYHKTYGRGYIQVF
ncbi:MAG: hypothetical protein HYU84_06415, partial [Chloroflexi bacterium]|nr:hypothetical protein [Chloroflexota bacterium]